MHTIVCIRLFTHRIFNRLHHRKSFSYFSPAFKSTLVSLEWDAQPIDSYFSSIQTRRVFGMSTATVGASVA
jgi:hypothetical protein